MNSQDAVRRLQEYAARNHLEAAPLSPGGEDGVIWQTGTDRNTVLKAFYHQDNYRNELVCYRRLAELGIDEIKGYQIPSVVAYDDDLLVIEMDLVQPPFILDFGKAKVDFKPDFSEETLREDDEKLRALWGDYYREVRSIIATLSGICGIYYPDPWPGNIKPRNWNPSLDDD
jgi:hypothetical protein